MAINVPRECPDGDGLRLLREALGLSQAELAAVLGFTKNGTRNVRQWEHDPDFRPTPTAWAAFRYFAIAASFHWLLVPGSNAFVIEEVVNA